MKKVWNGYYVIKYKDAIYKCFSIEDGYLRHICIYKDEIQIAELLIKKLVETRNYHTHGDSKHKYPLYFKYW